MGLFEGKTSTERNKMIAAGVLGLVALVALYMAFGRSFFGGSSSPATAKTTPTPRTTTSTGTTTPDRTLPTASELQFQYETTPVDYRPGYANAPDPGRNIFAFYEPPEPCRGADCPTPTPKPTPPPPTPSPVPTPPILLRAAIPQNVYAGSPAFKLQVDGEFFTADSRIYFNQTAMPTTFLNAQRLSADIPANLIVQEGQRTIEVRTPDGRLYSNPAGLMVNPPPKPNVQYIGMIGRKRYNNDTAYFIGGSAGQTPYGARLNDVVSGQFRLIDISPNEVVLEDINLGFKHRVPMTKAATGTGGGTGTPGFNPGSGFPSGSIPGIPDGVQRFIPPPPANRPPNRPQEKKEDVDDKDDPPSK